MSPPISRPRTISFAKALCWWTRGASGSATSATARRTRSGKRPASRRSSSSIGISPPSSRLGRISSRPRRALAMRISPTTGARGATSALRRGAGKIWGLIVLSALLVCCGTSRSNRLMTGPCACGMLDPVPCCRPLAASSSRSCVPGGDFMTAQILSAARLRKLLAQDGLLVAPGAYDCISARTIEQAGFSAVYMTGAGTAATLGYPDYGLLTMSEMADDAGRLAAAVKVPVIADADTGYGNELNAIRTVREYEKRGVAGIHIEDQGFPKKCGHLEDKTIVPLEDYVAKIRAAV